VRGTLPALDPEVGSPEKTATELSGGGSVGQLEVLRGGGPLPLWGLPVPCAQVRPGGSACPTS
jgi:hypothetical protein